MLLTVARRQLRPGSGVLGVRLIGARSSVGSDPRAREAGAVCKVVREVHRELFEPTPHVARAAPSAPAARTTLPARRARNVVARAHAAFDPPPGSTIRGSPQS